MCEKTIRRRLKENGCRLKVKTEIYSQAKCYQVIDKDENILVQDSDLESLSKRLFE